MRATLAAILAIASSAAMAGDMGGRTHPHRLFPSEITTYRSGTVELHFAARADDGGGYGGPGSYGSQPGGSSDRMGTGSNCIFCAGPPSNMSRGGSDGFGCNCSPDRSGGQGEAAGF